MILVCQQLCKRLVVVDAAYVLSTGGGTRAGDSLATSIAEDNVGSCATCSYLAYSIDTTLGLSFPHEHIFRMLTV